MRKRLMSRFWGVLLLFPISSLLAGSASSQTYKVLHNFCAHNDPNDGWGLPAGVTFGVDGNLYGTTFGGGFDCQVDVGYGIVFRLVPNPDGTWTENILHTFSGSDGGFPYAPVVFDSRGNLYGMTTEGLGYGTVFELMPGSDGVWTLSQLHVFTGGWDGGFENTTYPFGGLVFAGDGHFFGTTDNFGIYRGGVAFSLSEASALSWYELVAHPFGQGADGVQPRSAPTIGPDGSLYGTTFSGGSNNAGTVYRLTPNRRSFGWTETVLYSFQGTPYGSGNDGANPMAGVIFDAAGNIYGTTSYGGPAGYGIVFKLAPHPDGTWTESVIYAFRGHLNNDGGGPEGPVVFDGAGNLYGTTIGGGPDDDGTVYKLTPSSGGQWTETVVHSFNGQDGQWPISGLVLDNAGNLYGTTQAGGAGGIERGGVVFEITP